MAVRIEVGEGKQLIIGTPLIIMLYSALPLRAVAYDVMHGAEPRPFPSKVQPNT